MSNNSMKLAVLTVAIASAFISNNAVAAPKSHFAKISSISNIAKRDKLIDITIKNYSNTVALYDKNIAKYQSKYGSYSWFIDYVNAANWYKEELAKYKSFKEQLTVPVVSTETSSPAPTLTPFNVNQTLAPTAQWYRTPQGKLLVMEQLQQETVLAQGGVLAAWNRGFTGKGVTVAVIDQGFDTNHADLQGQVKDYQIFYPGSTYYTNYGTHGTSMASIIAGKLNNGIGTVGVAPEATLLLAQVGQGGTSANVNTKAVADALAWTESKGADIVSMSFSNSFDPNFRRETVSLGNGVYAPASRYSAMYGTSATLNSYIGKNKSSVLVSAAGNQGLGYSGYPGGYATATDANGNLLFNGRWLIVGSVNANNQISTFSNRAGHLCNDLVGTVCNDKYQVKDFYVVAPGERIVSARDTTSTTDSLASFSTGTSGATAYVAGGMALMKQAWPHLKAEQLVQLVLTTATDLGAPGVDEVYGHGLVNFDKATAPKGDLLVASTTATSSVTGSTVKASSTSATTNGTASFATNSILENAMVVDGIGRQYSVNLTSAVSAVKLDSYKYSSPWLALDSAGYKEISSPVGRNMTMKMMQTTNGYANQLDFKEGNQGYSMQFGVMKEGTGFLGNTGTGALAFGSSSTTFTQLGMDKTYGNTQVFGNYGVAFTKTGSVADSMISLDKTIISQSWKLGISQSNILFDDTTHDQLTLSVSAPVNIVKGKATITAVTDYEFTENADGSVDSRAVVSSERVSLRNKVQPLDLAMSYAVMSKSDTQVKVNLVHQINAGGFAGNSSTGVNVSYRMSF